MHYTLKIDRFFVVYFPPFHPSHYITLLRGLLKSNVSLVFSFRSSSVFSSIPPLYLLAVRSLHIVSPPHSFRFLILDQSEPFWDFVKNEDNP